MKFNLKTIAAAVALAAVASQASAALPVSTTTTGQSDLLFFAIDQTTGDSFVYDLGTSAALTGLTKNITGSAFSSYLSAEGGSLAATTWGLAYNQGSNAASSLWGTTLTSGTTIGSETSAKMSAGRVALNNFLVSTTLTGSGTSAFNNGGTAGNYTVGMKDSWGGNAAGWTTDNAVGTQASFYTVTQATAAAGGVFVGNFSFNGTTVAAVPEPESYAMFAAGLLMLGAVARRRKA